MNDLTRKEEKKLATAIVLEGIIVGSEVNNLIGDVYILPNNYEIREFATLINACGRLERPMEGVKLCLGEKKSAEDITAAYRRKIAQYLKWVEENKDKMRKTDKVTYLIAKNSINENFISPIVSIAIRSTCKTDIIFGFANSKDGVKVSARLSRSAKKKIDLGELVSEAAGKVDGNGGGHSLASGGNIPLGSEEKFINAVNKILHENE
jgi:RecJ-like exonuclease